jgi:tetratricopeptide (TPR) repeat protein
MKKLLTIILIISIIYPISGQSPNDAVSIVNAAKDKLAKQDYTGAIKEFNKALRYKAGLAEAYYGRAEAKYYLAQFEEALRDINKAIEINKEEPKVYLIRGEIYNATKKPSDALLDFDKALELKSNYSEALCQKALVLFQTGKEKNAFELLENSIETYQTDAILYYGRGVLFNNKQKYEKALEDFNKCNELDPEYNLYNLYLARGTAYMAMQEYNDAEREFSKAIELYPNNAIGYSSHARVNYEQSRYQEAIEDYSKSLQYNPDNAATYFNLGMAYYKIEDKKAACEKFHKACSMGNTNACKMVIVGCVEGK